jgi:hypothetical protein
LELQVQRGLLDLLDLKVFKEFEGLLDLLVQTPPSLVQLDLRVSREFRAFKESRVLRGSKVSREFRASKVSKEILDLQVILDLRGQLDLKVSKD